MDHSIPNDYMAHGFCFLWEPQLIWLHVISDIITGIAYFSIPVAMGYFIFKRRDLPFTYIFVFFALFIFACGTTHFFAVYTVYVPLYWQEGYVKAFTALVSIIAAIMFIPMIPKALGLPSITKALEDIKRLNSELESQLEELRIKDYALASSVNGIVFSDLNGNITYVNNAFLEMWGYENKEDVLGRSFSAFWESEDAALKVIESLKSSGKWTGELPAKKKNGILFHVFFIANKVITSTGAPIYYMASFTDITELKKLENQLRQSQKMEAVGQLAGGIAHDFNNILTAIIGYGHVTLMKMEKDDPLRLNIKHMLEGADRAAQLTRDILLFSRKQIMLRKSMDLNEIIKEVEKFIKKVIGEDIEHKTILHNQPLHVLADAYQIEQVMMNLATNARDAMPSGGAFIIKTEQVKLNEDFVSAHDLGKPGDYALITISDTGKGIDSETCRRIFEPFFTTKEVGKGTGLGMSVVYGIIKQHEGFINVSSEPGKGAAFRIYLPIIAPEAVEEEKVEEEEIPVGGTETILVAEDDESLRRLEVTVLRQYGYKVIEAVDGEDALSKFTENKESIQFLLFDIIMPKMSGKEAYDEIRKIKPDVKGIFISGYAPDILEQKASIGKGIAILLKPLAPTELLKKVREVLDS